MSFWWNNSLPYKLLDAEHLASRPAAASEWYHSAVVRWAVEAVAAAAPAGAAGLAEELRCPRGPLPGIHPASNLRHAEGAAFLTYVSARRLDYLDGAVLLGLSLRKHAPGVRTMALIEELESPPTGYVEGVLRKAGWELLVSVPKMSPPNAPPGSSNDGLHAKALMFNPDVIPFRRFVYLDSDAWVRSPRIMELLDPALVSPERPIMMTEDLNAPGMFSTGVMVAQPDKEFFNKLFPIVMAGHDNDQPAVNEAYRGRIAPLDPAFNVHAGMFERGRLAPEDAIVVHFTGQTPFKPMHADADHLREVRRGRGSDPVYGLRGGGCLFAEYFAWMAGEERLRHVSYELQTTIAEALL
uniref:Hexosyltransferase n=1 Tax=Alexandrium monilatum TaxID=311494 RepID=A0A7S4UBG9_9DINO